ncbi:unnamed protein product (macronuclear) [Paramecium tetraurelia]|uniref:Calpain catalytic domain-containing protein n=1 Tax=Paramecium tetraurelia TaxID=5888 RepID=A0C0S4_PARTE|nr:uncharacterized protein GSPATT00033867001 [Paramecium tetraurelia]CAK64391.1 unnamed protein product [Paramecium tetraurelia]|eukprot:XP_001431789.1 hypothetical protein (macronuclear) [Paramecium tetraurelia strain d4-2]
MQYENRKVYENAMDQFNEADIKEFQLKDFKNSNNLELYSLLLLDIQNSYYQDNNLNVSEFYNSPQLINAFNIVQYKMNNLKLLFESRDTNLFGVWLWKQGEQLLIYADDLIPCKKNGDNYQLATVISKYRWPIILEKAIGKLLGFEYESFNIIQNDSIEFYLQMMTGSEVYEQEFQSIEELQEKIKANQEIYYVKYTQDSKTIAAVISFNKNNQQENVNLIQLIAPNEQSVYKKGRQKHESSCYLTWEEFKQNFQSIFVLVWMDDYKYRVNSIILKNPIERKSDFIEHTYCYKFKISEVGNYQLTLRQNDILINNGKIDIKDQKLKNQLGLIRMLLFQELDQTQYKFIDGICDFKNGISINSTLQKGEYCIVCQGYFNYFSNYTEKQQLEQVKLNLSMAGLNLNFNIDPDHLDEQKQIKLITSLIKVKSQQEKIRYFNTIGQPQIKVTTSQNYGFLYFYYENRGTIDIQEEIEFIQLGYLLNYQQLQKQNKDLVVVKVNNFQILLYTLNPKIILSQDPKIFEFQYKHRIINDIQQSEVINQNGQNQQQKGINEIIQLQNTEVIQCDSVVAYINQHDQGMIIQFENISEKNVEVTLQFSVLENLDVVENTNFNKDGMKYQFSVQPQSIMVMLFDVIEPSNPYHYKMKLDCFNN